MVDESFDGLLEEVEDEDEQTEEDGFDEDGLVERSVLVAAADVHHLADEDDLAEYERVDEGEGEIHGGPVVPMEGEEHGVGGDGGEEDGQIGGDAEIVLELCDGALLEGGFVGDRLRGCGHG